MFLNFKSTEKNDAFYFISVNHVEYTIKVKGYFAKYVIVKNTEKTIKAA